MKKAIKHKAEKFGHISEALRSLAAPISSLMADEKNVRSHGDRNVDAIRASLERFGQQAPVVFVRRLLGKKRRKVVIKGNGLLTAAKAMGWTHLAAVESGLDGNDAMAFAIADNRTSDLSEFDAELLAAQMQELRGDGMELMAMGFTDQEVAQLGRSAAAVAEASGGKGDVDELDGLEQKFLAHPPAFTWTLIGIETTRYHLVTDALEAIRAVDEVVMKVSVTDARKQD